jgi:uncharacterized membrane protein (UPF0127 family)
MLEYNGKLIAKRIVYCDSLFRQGTGLLFRSKDSVSNSAWWFRFKKPRHVTVTMIMVFFSIDIVFLDKDNKVVELKENLRPFMNYRCRKNIYSFVELECGTIKKYSLRNGSRLKF